MPLRLAIHDSFNPDLLRSWESILEKDVESGVFATPSWLKVWWETLSGKELLIAVLLDEDGPVAVFPACKCVDEPGLLSLLGGEDVTDQQVPVCVPGREVESLEFFCDWAFSEGGFTTLRLHSVSASTRWPNLIAGLAATRGWTFHGEQVDVSPAIVLPDSFDDYLASLDGHDRHEIRRKRRRLNEAGEVVVRRAHHLGWEEDLAAFFSFHRKAPGPKADFFTPERERFFRRLAADLFLIGTARLDMLDLDGVPVAATFSYDYRGALELYNSAFEPDLYKLAPGMVLIGYLIENAIEEGKHTFDFLRGDERYKMRFGPDPRPVYKVELHA